MPVRRFERVEDLPGPTRVPSSELWDRLRALWSLSHRLRRPHRPPGVYKNRDVEEANRRRLAWDRQARAR